MRERTGDGIDGSPREPQCAARPFAILIALVLLTLLPLSFATNASSTDEWTSLGPNGGTVFSLVLDAQTPSTLYAGTYRGGAFKSLNRGATWQAASAGLDGETVQVLAPDPQNGNTLYAGTELDGVFKSTDGGATWQAASAGLTDTNIGALVVNPQTPATLYAGTGGGVFKSTDAGTTWQASGLAASYVYVLALGPLTPTTIYAGTASDGLFKSTDAGATWQAVNAGLTNLVVYSLAINPLTPTTLYAGTEGGVFKSTDAGATWQAVNAGLTNLFVYALAPDPQDPATLYAGTGGGVFKSTDAGTTWQAVNAGLTNVFVYALALDPQTSTTLYAGVVYEGVFKSTDAGTTWQAVNAGLSNLVVYSLAINPLTPATLYAGTGGGVFKSENGGTSWQAVNAGLSNLFVYALALDPLTPATLYAGTGGGVFKSTDAGATWQASGLAASYVAALAVNPQTHTTLYAGTGGGVFKSTDSGATWQASGLTNAFIAALALEPQTSARLYAGTDGGVFKSTDAGATWQASGLTNATVNAISINVQIPATLYAGTGGGVFRSTDAGATWQATNVGLSNTNVYNLALDSAAPTTLYAGTGGGGVFRQNPTPPAASLVGPSGTVMTATPTYTWTAVPSATRYYLWVQNGSGTPMLQTWYPAAQVGCAAGTGSCSVTPSASLAAGSYTWWVQTWNANGNGAWSSGLGFAVPSLPSAATLVGPSGTITTATPTYTWTAVPSATWYYLWVQDSASATKIQQWYTSTQLGCASGVGTCSITPGTALAPGDAIWWVQTWNANGYGPWSSGLGFAVTLGPPPAASQVGPSGTVTTATPTYTWTAVPSATWYYLWVQNGSGTPMLQTWYPAAQVGCAAGTGSCSVTPSTSLAAGSYTWWVQTWNANGYGPWSSGLRIAVTLGPPPAASLVGPSGTVTTATPTYTWAAIPGVSWYYLWVQDSASATKIQQWYTSTQLGCAGGVGTCSITPGTALAPGDATWWVQTWNPYGYGPWSSGLGFTVTLL